MIDELAESAEEELSSDSSDKGLGARGASESGGEGGGKLNRGDELLGTVHPDLDGCNGWRGGQGGSAGGNSRGERGGGGSTATFVEK